MKTNKTKQYMPHDRLKYTNIVAMQKTERMPLLMKVRRQDFLSCVESSFGLLKFGRIDVCSLVDLGRPPGLCKARALVLHNSADDELKGVLDDALPRLHPVLVRDIARLDDTHLAGGGRDAAVEESGFKLQEAVKLVDAAEEQGGAVLVLWKVLVGAVAARSPWRPETSEGCPSPK